MNRGANNWLSTDDYESKKEMHQYERRISGFKPTKIKMDVFGLKEKNAMDVAIIENGKIHTYGKLLEDIKQFSKQIPGRCVVLIVMQNVYEAIQFYLGTFWANSVPLLMNITISAEKLNGILRIYRPSKVLTLKNKFDILDGYVKERIYDNYDMWRIENKEEIDYKMNENLALLLSTSGSTGSPKYVKISYENLISNTKSIITYLDIKSTDRMITTLPMDYTYGLSLINTHLKAGASIVVCNESIIKRKFWDDLKQNMCTTLAGVPFTYEMIVRLNFFEHMSGLKYLTQAGGKIRPSIAKKMITFCRDNKCKFIMMYGQTEATARMSYLRWEDATRKLGSIGKTIPGGEFEVLGENGVEVRSGIEGELIYKGKNVMMGYSENRFDLEKGDVCNGVLHTGDLAYYDDEGFFFITGRLKRFVKIYGKRVNLDELEQAINESGVECACIGDDDKINLIINKIVERDKIMEVISLFGIEKQCIQIVYMAEFCYTSNGKIDYAALERKMKEESLLDLCK